MASGLDKSGARPHYSKSQQSHSGLHERPNKAATDKDLLKPSSHFISNIIKYTQKKKKKKMNWMEKPLEGDTTSPKMQHPLK